MAAGVTNVVGAPPDDTAMIIGLGSGVTAGAVATWPFDRIVAAEIEL